MEQQQLPSQRARGAPASPTFAMFFWCCPCGSTKVPLRTYRAIFFVLPVWQYKGAAVYLQRFFFSPYTAGGTRCCRVSPQHRRGDIRSKEHAKCVHFADPCAFFCVCTRCTHQVPGLRPDSGRAEAPHRQHRGQGAALALPMCRLSSRAADNTRGWELLPWSRQCLPRAATKDPARHYSHHASRSIR